MQVNLFQFSSDSPILPCSPLFPSLYLSLAYPCINGSPPLLSPPSSLHLSLTSAFIPVILLFSSALSSPPLFPPLHLSQMHAFQFSHPTLAASLPFPSPPSHKCMYSSPPLPSSPLLSPLPVTPLSCKCMYSSSPPPPPLSSLLRSRLIDGVWGLQCVSRAQGSN